MSEFLDAALTYARMGWHVFPCESPVVGNPTSGKRPIGRLVPNGKDDATVNPDQIRAWWAACPNANIGIATEPSGLVVLDVDIAGSKGGDRSLLEINDQLTLTLTAETGSGGVHAVYLRGSEPARQSLGVRPGLDIIGKGYIIAAPSKHHSGGTYKWINQREPVEQPEIIKTIQRAGREIKQPIVTGERNFLGDQSSLIVAASLIADAFPKTGRHAAFFALSGALAQESWSAEEIAEFTCMVSRLINTDASGFAKRPLQAVDSVAKVQSGQTVAGWGVLATMIPQGVIDAVHERLGITNHEYDWMERDRPIMPASGPIDLGSLGSITPEDVDREIAKGAAGSVRDPGILWIADLAQREFPAVVSYETQYPELNSLLGGGISTQMLTILLGKPGAGKTALFMSIALHLGRLVEQICRVPVLYVSTELQHNELVARLASPLLRAPWRDIVRGIAVDSSGKRITVADCARVLADYRIAIIAQDEIYSAGEKAVELIARTAQKIKTQTGISPVVMVDYLQELARGDDAKARQQNTKVAVTFRMLSQRLDCAFFAVSSVSRAGYGKAAVELRASDNPEVYLALAKESGDIDYAAATIMFLDVGDEKDGNGWKMGRMAVSKSRHGETGFAGMRFYGAYGTWEQFAGGVQALSAESQGTSKVERQIEDIKGRALAKVRELSMLAADPLGNSSLKGKTELKILLGGNSTQAGVAIEALIREGVLVERFEEAQNPSTKKITSRKVIALPATGSIVVIEEAVIDRTAMLMGIVGAGASVTPT